MAHELGFYILRPGDIHRSAHGEFDKPYAVPLIPMDMLPECLQVEGLRRHLNWDEMASNQNLGLMPPAGEPLRVRFVMGEFDDSAVMGVHQNPTPGQSSQVMAPYGGTHKAQDQSVEYSSESACSDPRPKPRQGLASSRHNIKVNLPSPASSSSSSLNHEPQQGEPGKKKAKNAKRAKQRLSNRQLTRNTKGSGVCRRFVVYNSCKYGKMCWYKHELPPEPEGSELQSLYTYVKTGRLPTMPGADSPSSVSSMDRMGATGMNMKKPAVSMEARTEDGEVEDTVADLIDFSID